MRRVVANTLSGIAFALFATGGAWATDAPEVTDSSVGAQYIAEMPATGDQGVIAQIVAASLLDGSGVSFSVNINGKTFDGGPFLYHIHDQPVPTNGNCTATLAHLDPYARGEDPPCDSSNPSSCQVGDLSGKHGKIQSLPGFSANYTDKYVSLTPGAPAYFGNRSVVLHFANKTRIACANFVRVERNNTLIMGSNSTTSGGGGGIFSTPLPTGPSSKPSGTSSSVPSGGAHSGGMAVKAADHVILGPLLFGLAAAVL